MTLGAQVTEAMEAQDTKAMDTQDTDAMEAQNTKTMKMVGVRQNSWTKIVSIIIDYHAILLSKKAQISYYQTFFTFERKFCWRLRLPLSV